MPSSSGASELAGRRGLALAYGAMERVVERHGLSRAAFVVEVEGLGRQLIVDRHRALSDDDAELLEQLAGSGWQVTPEIDPDDLDLEMATALVAAALRAAVLDADEDGRPADHVELAIRRLDGVRAVAVDLAGGAVQVLSEGRTPLDLARRVSTLAARLDPGLTVEVIRTLPRAAAGGPAAGETGSPGAPEEGGETGTAESTTSFELVVVANAVETQELEVHVRLDGVRTIGRAPAARGLAGAVEATLTAVRELRAGPPLDLDWVRTVETTVDRQFLVAVSMHDTRSGAPHYGMADGATPIEAAARATLVAVDV